MTPGRRDRTPVVLLATALVTTSLLAGGWMLLRAGRAAPAPIQPTVLFEQVLTHVRRFGVDSLADAELYRRAASGLMHELDDEFATIRPVGERRNLPPDVGGLGLLLTARGGRVAVLSVLPDSPADIAGVAAGDQVVEVGDLESDGLTRDAVLAALDGPPGSSITLRLRRPTVGQVLEFRLRRGEPRSHWLTDVVDLGDGIQYVGVRLFGGEGSRELHRMLRDASENRGRGLILDLRGASGSDLEAGVAVASLFLPQGSPIVTVRSRDGGDRKRTTRSGGDFPNGALVVLVNRTTADAAEVVAGALQDNDRALLVGQPSFGRGVSTEDFPLDSRMVVRMTTARWVTPSGRAIQPDSAAFPADSIRRRPSFRTQARREVRGGGGIVPDSIVVRSPPSDAEQTFLRAFGGELPELEAALRLTAARRVRSGGSRISPSFEPTIQDLEAVRQALAARRVRLVQQIWSGGEDYLRRELGELVVLEALGQRGLILRRAEREPMLSLAVRLLRGASGSAELLGLAPRATTARRP